MRMANSEATLAPTERKLFIDRFGWSEAEYECFRDGCRTMAQLFIPKDSIYKRNHQTGRDRANAAAEYGLHKTWLPKLMEHLTEDKARQYCSGFIHYQRAATHSLKAESTTANLKQIPSEPVPARSLTAEARFTEMRAAKLAPPRSTPVSHRQTAKNLPATSLIDLNGGCKENLLPPYGKIDYIPKGQNLFPSATSASSPMRELERTDHYIETNFFSLLPTQEVERITWDEVIVHIVWKDINAKGFALPLGFCVSAAFSVTYDHQAPVNSVFLDFDTFHERVRSHLRSKGNFILEKQEVVYESIRSATDRQSFADTFTFAMAYDAWSSGPSSFKAANNKRDWWLEGRPKTEDAESNDVELPEWLQPSKLALIHKLEDNSDEDVPLGPNRRRFKIARHSR